MTGLPDRYGDGAAAYAAHRPSYPAELVDFLAGAAPRPDVAWDAGCGSGQLSVPLAERFARVIATDASARQIALARPHPRVEYHHARAEASGLPDVTVDLAVAAQAAHWFDLAAYYAEVRRVARPGAVVALVTYGVMSVDGAVDPVMRRFYREIAGPYWPPERRHVEDGYRSLPFPFDEIAAPSLAIRVQWTLDAVLAYVETWSAVRALRAAQGAAPLEALRDELARLWDPPTAVRAVRWPLTVRAGRV